MGPNPNRPSLVETTPPIRVPSPSMPGTCRRGPLLPLLNLLPHRSYWGSTLSNLNFYGSFSVCQFSPSHGLLSPHLSNVLTGTATCTYYVAFTQRVKSKNRGGKVCHLIIVIFFFFRLSNLTSIMCVSVVRFISPPWNLKMLPIFCDVYCDKYLLPLCVCIFSDC